MGYTFKIGNILSKWSPKYNKAWDCLSSSRVRIHTETPKQAAFLYSLNYPITVRKTQKYFCSFFLFFPGTQRLQTYKCIKNSVKLGKRSFTGLYSGRELDTIFVIKCISFTLLLSHA